MSRPFEKVAKLVTQKAPDEDWDLVRGAEVSWAPSAEVPFALDRNREYAIRWNGDRWELYSRNANKKPPQGIDPE